MAHHLTIWPYGRDRSRLSDWEGIEPTMVLHLEQNKKWSALTFPFCGGEKEKEEDKLIHHSLLANFTSLKFSVKSA